jgi:D-glycero-beta-D-manno-heptose-7-phosphate kinase
MKEILKTMMEDARANSPESLIARIPEFSKRRVTVLGDLIADQFVYGAIARVSREAPVLILRHERTETVPGGAANCAMNLAALGAGAIKLIGVMGEDEAGRSMIDKLTLAGVDCRRVVSTSEIRTTTKVRVLAGHAHSTRQQVIRVDYENAHALNREMRAALVAHLHDSLKETDAVIVCDYNYGVADREMIDSLRSAISASSRVPVFVDSRFRLTDFSDFTSATPNAEEIEFLANKTFADEAKLEEIGESLRARLNYRSLLITRGSQGMLLLEDGAPPLHIPPVGAREAVDVTGAGDTVIATFALAVTSGASFAEAARLANHAGGIVVMKRGTACISSEELVSSVQTRSAV